MASKGKKATSIEKKGTSLEVFPSKKSTSLEKSTVDVSKTALVKAPANAPVARLKPITFIQFGVLTPKQWERLAVVKITQPYMRGGKTKDTTYDERLGALDNTVVCKVCGEKNKGCPGHFGIIELEEVVYHPDYIKICVEILKCICPRVECAAPRISKETAALKGILHTKNLDRLLAIKKESKYIKACPVCKLSIPTIKLSKKKEGIITFAFDTTLAGTHKLSASSCYDIFSQISDATMELLGFNSGLSTNPQINTPEGNLHKIRPEAFLISVLPVLPTSARPWVLQNGEKKDDDLTEKYNIILRLNNQIKDRYSGAKRLRSHLKDDRQDKTKLVQDLQNQVWALFSNSKAKAINGRTQKGIRDRLCKKNGHIQMNVGGKRVDFNARTPIVSAGYLLPSGTIGCPEVIAKHVTEPELVTPFNKEALEVLLAQGKINYVLRRDKKIDVNQVTAKHTKPFINNGIEGLLLGDVVERHLQNGDVGIFNRQPTLRIESMQGVRLHIFKKEYAFRLTLDATRSYNADFDGDEMNLHAVQSIGARVECEVVMASKQHIVSAQTNAPILGCVQNTLIVWYELTNNLTYDSRYSDTYDKFAPYISTRDVYDCCCIANISWDRVYELAQRAIHYYPNHIQKVKGNYFFVKDRIPGKLFFSLFLPPDLFYERTTNKNDKFPRITIQRGILLPDSGPVCKKIIGIAASSTIHYIWKNYGPSVAERYISELQMTASYYIGRYGLSLGVSDCVPTSREKIDLALKQAKIECEMVMTTEKPEVVKEMSINSILNRVMSIAPVMAKTSMNKGERNALVIFKKCEAKGSDANNGSISWCIGQTNVDGKRIPFSLSNQTRSLPHFDFYDTSPKAKGFIESSYLQGITPSEFWFHAYSGRRGVIDTAMKTSQTGYTQKRIVQKLADHKVYPDGSVRDASGNLIEPFYGGDGMNAKFLIYTKNLKTPWFIDPFSIAKMINNLAIERGVSTQVRALKANEISEITSKIGVSWGNYKIASIKWALYYWRDVLRTALKGVKLVEAYIPVFQNIVVETFERSRAEYGYMAGLVAACSIGEIGTQLTLNTFHNVSRFEKDITLGVPRLNELIGATQNPSKSTNTIFLDSPILDTLYQESQKEKAYQEVMKISNKLPLLKVKDLVVNKEMFCTEETQAPECTSPIVFKRHKIYEQPWWSKFYLSNLNDEEVIQPKSWIIRLNLDPYKVMKSGLELEEIANLISVEYCESSSSGCKKVLLAVPSPTALATIDIYIDFDEVIPYMQKPHVKTPLDLEVDDLVNSKNVDYFTTREVIMKFVLGITLGGIAGITRSYVRELNVKECKPGQYVIETQGSSFSEVMALAGVDTDHTISDGLWEVYRVLGVEAATKFLQQETTKVLCFDGSYINPRHVSLMARSMTFSGTIKGCTRNGISRDVGPIAKGMFENSIDNFSLSSLFGETDHMQGVFSAIMFGTQAKAGTGLIEVIDTSK